MFTALLRVATAIYYCKTKRGLEVDFVARMEDRLVQVCESMVEPKTRKREIAALSDAMVEMDIKTGTIVTRNEDDQFEVDHGEIEVMPIWRFLLSLPEMAYRSNGNRALIEP